MSRLLVINDDVEFCGILSDCLQPEGFEVSCVNGGKKGLRQILDEGVKYDLILLDMMLPGMSDFRILQRLRSELDVPVLMLTRRNKEVDNVVGFGIGADDFLLKPLNPRELAASVREILQKVGNWFPERIFPSIVKLTVGDIELDTGARMVSRDGKRIDLTSAEFNLLEELLRAAGQVVSREQLTEKALGRDACGRSLDVHVCRLRKKLGGKLDGSERIKCVRSTGYIYADRASCRRGMISPGRNIPKKCNRA